MPHHKNPAAPGTFQIGDVVYAADVKAGDALGFTRDPDGTTTLTVNGAPVEGSRVDPTRLDPPIVIDVTIALWDDAEREALAHLNRLHGWPAGTMPLSVKGSPEHIEATSTLLRGHRVRLLVTHIGADGRPTFALAPSEKA